MGKNSKLRIERPEGWSCYHVRSLNSALTNTDYFIFKIKWLPTRTYCIAAGTLLHVMWQPGWQGSWRRMGTYIYGCIYVYELEQTLGDNEGQGSLVCCSPWGRKEQDTTELTYLYICIWLQRVRHDWSTNTHTYVWLSPFAAHLKYHNIVNRLCSNIK